MTDKFCSQCGRPLDEAGKQDVRASWGFSWGLLWRQMVIGLVMYIPLCILIWIFFLLAT